MKTVPLGSSPVTVSTVALGTWTFAGDAIWGKSEEARCVSVVHAAIDRGITLFDSAPNYGNGRSEEILGKAVANRSDVFVATKFKIDGRTAADLRKMVDESRSRLRRDRIDLMQVHWPGATPDDTQRGLETLFLLREEGAIANVGVCNFGVFDLDETAELPIVSNQIPYNLLWRSVEGDEGIARRSRTLGRTTIAYSVLQQGLLTGRYSALAEFPTGRRRTRHFNSTEVAANHSDSGFERETDAALKGFLDVANTLGRSPIELALSFVATTPDIDVMLLGARTVDQLERSCDAAESRLTQVGRLLLEEATEPLRRAVGAHADMYQSRSRIRFPDSAGRPIRRATP